MHYLHNLIKPIILCGGSGTRLWPLSRKAFPKQFVPLINNKSLLQLTLERVMHLVHEQSSSNPVCIAAEEHRFLVSETMKAVGTNGATILEPVSRNTAAAIALATLQSQPEELLLFCPADHHIPDSHAFTAMVNQGIRAAQAGFIVTFGVVPSFPSTAYGYIEQGALNTDGVSYQVARFVEKPHTDKAQSLILQGNVLWNAGIFLAKAKTLLDSLQTYAPDILHSCEQAMTSKTEDRQDGQIFIRPNAAIFEACRSESIDYAVIEHHSKIAVVPFHGVWSDVGSWNAVADLITPDINGNQIDGNGLAMEATRTYIHSRHRPVVALGTSDLFIIDTPDAVLISHRDYAEQVKEVVAELNKQQFTEAIVHRRVARPWGWYDSIAKGERFQVKRIGVKPGATLSLQKHHHRAEHWVVVKGTAEVTRGSKTFLLSENQSTYIPIGEVHRLKNPGKLELEMIEVQSGSYLGEDDIVRLEDAYGRTIEASESV